MQKKKKNAPWFHVGHSHGTLNKALCRKGRALKGTRAFGFGSDLSGKGAGSGGGVWGRYRFTAPSNWLAWRGTSYTRCDHPAGSSRSHPLRWRGGERSPEESNTTRNQYVHTRSLGKSYAMKGCSFGCFAFVEMEQITNMSMT